MTIVVAGNGSGHDGVIIVDVMTIVVVGNGGGDDGVIVVDGHDYCGYW